MPPYVFGIASLNPYLSRYPCVLSIMSLQRYGSSKIFQLCSYDPSISPSVGTLQEAKVELCKLLAQHLSLQEKSNWGLYCGNDTAQLSPAWDGIYFLEKYLGIHLPRMGLEGGVTADHDCTQPRATLACSVFPLPCFPHDREISNLPLPHSNAAVAGFIKQLFHWVFALAVLSIASLGAVKCFL